MAKKPEWVVEKEKARKEEGRVWLFGLHAVRDALENPARVKRQLLVTKNAYHKLQASIGDCPVEVFDPHRFHPPIDRNSVHQGAVLDVDALDWGGIDALYPKGAADIVILLDRVTDPHNVGAVMRSAEVFGARAVVAPYRHSAPETGALAKTASGALERQPYIRVQNLAEAMNKLRDMGYRLIGLDGEGESEISQAVAQKSGPIALVLGAEGPGMREKTREECDVIARIPYASQFGSLNVSNAAAISLFAARQARPLDA